MMKGKAWSARGRPGPQAPAHRLSRLLSSGYKTFSTWRTSLIWSGSEHCRATENSRALLTRCDFDNYFPESVVWNTDRVGSPKAFESFINLNEKSSEFISLFIDDNLKRGLKGVSRSVLTLLNMHSYLSRKRIPKSTVFWTKQLQSSDTSPRKMSSNGITRATLLSVYSLVDQFRMMQNAECWRNWKWSVDISLRRNWRACFMIWRFQQTPWMSTEVIWPTPQFVYRMLAATLSHSYF